MSTYNILSVSSKYATNVTSRGIVYKLKLKVIPTPIFYIYE